MYLVREMPGSPRFNPDPDGNASLTAFESLRTLKVGAHCRAAGRSYHRRRQTARRRRAHRGNTIRSLSRHLRQRRRLLTPLRSGRAKFTDHTHLRPVFVREHLHFLDPLLK